MQANILAFQLAPQPKKLDCMAVTFLPIVQRELRVATRRRATYWNRSVAVLLASAMAAWVLVSYSSSGPAQLGATLFSGLSQLAFLACLFPGVFLTADCLSREKRDGTLGLLFLTDLRGYDVVLGKLLATSLNAFYALVAIFPVLELPLLMGGVTFAEFCRTMLVLVNTVIFSLALGMLISSVSWKEQKSMMSAAGLLFGLGIILPALGSLGEWVSPRMGLRLAVSANFSTQPWQFFASLAGFHAVSWGLLLLASRKARECWQLERLTAVETIEETALPIFDDTHDLPEAKSVQILEPAPGENTGDPESSGGMLWDEMASRRQRRRELLGRDPIEWLASRQRASGWVWGSLVVIAIGWFVVCLETARSPGRQFIESFYMAASLHLLLKFWIAWEASRRFADDRRSGTLELLLCTPLSLAEILRGQIRFLYNQFAGPMRAVIILDFILMSWLGSSSLFGASLAGSIGSFVLMMGMLLVDAWALAWLGLWLGLRAKTAWIAAFGALARIILLPMVIFLVIGLVALWSRSLSSPMPLIPVWAVLGGGASWLFGSIAQEKLRTQIRQAIAEGVAGVETSPASHPETEFPTGAQNPELFSLLR